MDWLSATFLLALLNIILIDLVLAGDNAIVIALAARNLPKEQQKGAILWGTVGAVVIRIVATLAVVWLLKLPALLLIGGLVLIWIAYKLLVDNKEHDISAKPKLADAIRTIIIADAAMGFDNVIAVAGASHGSFLLVVLGLIISVPIMVWGSTLFIKLVDRFPIIIWLGSAVLAYTAAKMITEDRFVADYFHANPVVKWMIVGVVVVGVLALGYLKKKSVTAVHVTDKGYLAIPEVLEKVADIQPNDSFTASRDKDGRLILVKSRN
ncbi:integral membrane protein, YjbE family [Paenibacillus sp. UNCCL117]|uniref:TerC family protein n=1 Tax=unclassified Paenibacillus TaxID=185978 RepID=UPI0008863A5A|nr:MULTISPECIES: TerC family protein [unclassified Paenibacillus]SDC21215.1 integral membrane protein, YjbE family [Paenibacillus sp. cl123]SFW18772.1 integral membrane protein, YjbE family [Paenibacillus sp. UNCCL117]